MGGLAVTIKVNVALLTDALVSSLQSRVLHIHTGRFTSSFQFGRYVTEERSVPPPHI